MIVTYSYHIAGNFTKVQSFVKVLKIPEVYKNVNFGKQYIRNAYIIIIIIIFRKFHMVSIRVPLINTA